MSAMQILTITNSSFIKKYGLNKVLGPFMEDINTLETVSTVIMYYNNIKCRMVLSLM